MYDLPSMNDLIEGMVVYVSKLHRGLSVSSTDLLPFIEEGGRPFPNDNTIGKHYSKGRLAFNVTPRSEEAIRDMRKNSADNFREGIDEDFLKAVSDPVLIRACVYYVISQMYCEFHDNLYVSFLFGFRPFALSFGVMSSGIKNEIPLLTELEKNNLRKIAWDEGIIKDLYDNLYNDLGDEDPVDATTPIYQSRGFDFSYYYAFVGYVVFRISLAQDRPAPPLLVRLFIDEGDIKRFTHLIEEIRAASHDFNSSLITNQQKN